MGPRRRRRRAPAPGAARGQPSATWAGETRGQRTPWPYPAGTEGPAQAARRIRGGEVLFCTSFRPLAARGTHTTDATSRDWSPSVPQSNRRGLLCPPQCGGAGWGDSTPDG